MRLTKKNKKEIFSKVVWKLVEIFCETQTYTWQGKFFRQEVGLPIGPRATSAIARIVMNWFDEKIGSRLKKFDLVTDLHIRYIDDIKVITSKLTIIDEKLEIDNEKAGEDMKSKDPGARATARFLREVMDEAIDGIKFTTEIQEDFEDEWC